ncbi:hypothetical protein LINPERPRIM_LOCUS3877 [Linum perenne]
MAQLALKGAQKLQSVHKALILAQDYCNLLDSNQFISLKHEQIMSSE